MNLIAATIGGDLACVGSQFNSKGKAPALDANGVKVAGSVFLRNGFKAEGEVNFGAATIGRVLACEGSQFKAPALDADEQLNEQLNFQAVMMGLLTCDVGQDFFKGDAPALHIDGVKVEGSVSLRDGFKAEGKVNFRGAYVGHYFQWIDVQSPEKSILDLRFTRVGTLLNHQNSRLTAGNLYIDGFVYDQIDDSACPNAEAQLDWLSRQPRDRFLSQPYEQLAAVFGKMGLEQDARKVMIAKNKNQAAHLHWRLAWLWYGLVGQLIGYGYRPGRAFIISLGVIIVGWWVFDFGYRLDLVTPPEEKAYVAGTRQLTELYPRFNAFVYSLETFVPLLKLGISQYWMPNATRSAPLRLGNQQLQITAGLLRGYLWFHVIAGWVLTTLWVGGLTGLVKT